MYRSGNLIGDEGALTLVRYLEDLDHIEHVALHSSNVTKEGLSKMLEFRVKEDIFKI